MIEKGLMTTEAVDRFAEIYENEVGPQLGAKVVAKAWTDPEFKARLLDDATEACAELGIGGLQGEEMVVVENTDTSTTPSSARCARATPGRCSACPRTGTSSPPTAPGSCASPARCCARSSATTSPDTVEVRVWDSSSELRYWVLPQRPAGTEG